MAGTGFGDDIVTPALGHALVAGRAQAALRKMERSQPLTMRDKKALEDARAFVHKAGEGREVLESRSMKSYRFESVSAYRAALRAAPEGQIDEIDLESASRFLLTVEQALTAAEQDEAMAEPWTPPKLGKFFEVVFNVCLQSTGRPIETVSMQGR